MKILALLFLSFFTLFFGQKQTHPSTRYHQTQILGTTTNAGIPIPSNNSQCHAKNIDPTDQQAYLPDQNCTPGVTNPQVTQDNINTTICVKGFTKTIRPPASYTDQLKLQQIQQYGFADTNPKDYEEDHFISLELGGAPSDPKNLWPEPHSSINEKDKVENYLHAQVCSGQITLAQAQTQITQNWYQVYKQLPNP